MDKIENQVVVQNEAVELTADMIGGPADDFTKPEKGDTCVRRANLMREGYHAGFKSAADDYCNGKVDLTVFEKLRTERDITDFYAIGFELGYFRKLSEILVG